MHVGNHDIFAVQISLVTVFCDAGLEKTGRYKSHGTALECGSVQIICSLLLKSGNGEDVVGSLHSVGHDFHRVRRHVAGAYKVIPLVGILDQHADLGLIGSDFNFARTGVGLVRIDLSGEGDLHLGRCGKARGCERYDAHVRAGISIYALGRRSRSRHGKYCLPFPLETGQPAVRHQDGIVRDSLHHNGERAGLPVIEFLHVFSILDRTQEIAHYRNTESLSGLHCKDEHSPGGIVLHIMKIRIAAAGVVGLDLPALVLSGRVNDICPGGAVIVTHNPVVVFINSKTRGHSVGSQGIHFSSSLKHRFRTGTVIDLPITVGINREDRSIAYAY